MTGASNAVLLNVVLLPVVIVLKVLDSFLLLHELAPCDVGKQLNGMF
jgi:hypothetical protein